MRPRQEFYPNKTYYPAPATAGANNRTVYINKNFAMNMGATKVLVNPNFKHNVHINPNFEPAKTVYINPSVFSQRPPNYETPLVPAPPPPKPPPVSVSRFSKVNKVTTTSSIAHIASKSQNIKAKRLKVDNRYESRSKYKYVKSDAANTSHPSTISKFKLDNRTVIKSRFRLRRKASLVNLDPQNIIKRRSDVGKFKLDNRKSIRRKSGVKLPPTALVRKSIRPASLSKSPAVPKVFVLKGETYRIRPTRLSPYKYTRHKHIVVRGHTYVKVESAPKRKKAACNLVKINKKVLKKDNQPCQTYTRTGVCETHSKGECIKRHDPNQISICAKFLQGACVKKDCRLSHDVSPEKMPTCKFYLEGICRNDDCRYVHVKLSRDAEICRRFLEGYCVDGLQCMKRHQFLCPVNEKTGKCAKKNCPYPHGDAVRQYKDVILNKIARSTRKTLVLVRRSRKARPVVERKAPKEEPPAPRYYKAHDSSAQELLESNVANRPKLGDLPAFIPFK